jgi:hypothetical protein
MAWANRYQDARFGPEQTEKFTRTIKAGRGATLDLQNIAGSITVTGITGDDIVIEAVKRVRARDEARAKALLAEMEIRVDDRAGRVIVRTTYPRRTTAASAAVDYTVRVPQDASVDLSSVSGDLRVTNVKGDLRLETVNGEVHAGQVPRLTLAKSMSGNIEVTGQIDGELNASSLTGLLLLRGVKARAVELTTISGDVVLTDVLVDRARVRSVNGDVRFASALVKNGRYDMNSHSGSIEVKVPAATGFELDASTFSGNVRSDIPLTLFTSRELRPGRVQPPQPPTPPTPPQPPDRPGEKTRVIVRENTTHRMSQTIRGTAGDAGAYILIRTFSGDIVLATVPKPQ